MYKNKIIIDKMERIYQILNELQYCEMEQAINVQRNQRNIIRYIEKLQEYNEIDDMNNAIINRKLDEIIQKV